MALEYRKINKRGYQLQYGSIHSCKKCPYLTKSIFFMLNHVKCHKQQKDKFECKRFPEIFSCKQCDFTTSLTTRFNQHFKRIHGRKQQKENFVCKLYQCKNCSFQTYSLLIWLKQHARGCRKVDKNPAVLEKKSTPERTNHSDFRLKEDAAAKSLTDHPKNHNPDTSRNKVNVSASRATLSKVHKWYKCNQCIFRTMNRQSLAFHRKIRHPKLDDIPTFKCTSCAFVTSNANHFRVHKLKHTSSFDCNKCSAKFTSLNPLIRHKIKEHVDNTIRRNKCDVNEEAEEQEELSLLF